MIMLGASPFAVDIDGRPIPPEDVYDPDAPLPLSQPASAPAAARSSPGILASVPLLPAAISIYGLLTKNRKLGIGAGIATAVIWLVGTQVARTRGGG
jgi:hypothetical protein